MAQSLWCSSRVRRFRHFHRRRSCLHSQCRWPPSPGDMLCRRGDTHGNWGNKRAAYGRGKVSDGQKGITRGSHDIGKNARSRRERERERAELRKREGGLVQVGGERARRRGAGTRRGSIGATLRRRDRDLTQVHNTTRKRGETPHGGGGGPPRRRRAWPSNSLWAATKGRASTSRSIRGALRSSSPGTPMVLVLGAQRRWCVVVTRANTPRRDVGGFSGEILVIKAGFRAEWPSGISGA
jgi:hypothetical protein